MASRLNFPNLKEDTVVAKFYDSTTVIQFLSNSGSQTSITKTDFSAYFKAFAGILAKTSH